MVTFLFARLVRLLPGRGRRWVTYAWHVVRIAGFLLAVRAMYSLHGFSAVLSDPQTPRWVTVVPVSAGFTIMAVADYVVGRDRSNLAPRMLAVMSKVRIVRLLPLLALPGLTAIVVAGARLVSSAPHFDWISTIGWTLSGGYIAGYIGISAAHELIHRPTRFERVCGGLLLSLTCYGTFKVEHVWGHHVDVATPEDASSADKDCSIYAFIPRAIVRNIGKAWRLQTRWMRARGFPVYGWRNELIWWTAFSAAFCVGLGLTYGPVGAAFFLGQASVAICLLETVNYIEHYGLRRKKLADGRYEPVSSAHSWDAPYLISSWYLLNLPRHADHHVRASRPFHVLAHRPEAPQRPGGYTAMVSLALVPFLWRRVIHPRIPTAAANDGGESAQGVPAPHNPSAVVGEYVQGC